MFMGEGELIVQGGDEHFVQGEGEQSVPGGMNNMFTQTQENTPANKPEEHMASPSAPAQTAFIQEPQPEPKKRSRSEKAKDFDLDNLQVPDWMPKETWQQYIDHRKTMKKPMSVNSAETLIKQLGIAKQNGWSPENIMNSAISSGYQGCVFEKHLLPNPNQSAGNGNNGKPRILTRRDCDPGPIESYLHTELHDKYGQTGLQQIPKAA